MKLKVNGQVLLVLNIVFIFYLIVPSLAVKSYLFKKCEQSGFCTRQRHYAKSIFPQVETGSYEPRYSIDISSFNIEDSKGKLNATLLKQLNDGTHIPLTLTVSLLESNDLRVEIDEFERRSIGKSGVVNPLRYNEASKWAFVDETGPILKSFTHSLDSESLSLKYDDDEGNEYIVQIYLYPFRITISLNGSQELIMNDRSLLNLEHFRTEEEQEVADSIHIQPEESTFDSFSDSFKDSKKDSLPLGPESIGVDFTMVGYTHVFGIPEHADSLSLKDTRNSDPYRLYNVDIFEYEIQSKLPMYGSIPFMIGVKPFYSSGIFFVNSADSYIDITKLNKEEGQKEGEDQKIMKTEESKENKVQSHWMFENGKIDVILMVKPNIQGISKSYGKLTGYTPLPNLFSIGYHQCRWNYNDEEDVLEINSLMDEHKFPYDTIWLDIEYTDNKKYFTWKKEAFPDHERMLSKLDETGRNLVAIIDPHIKTGYEVSNAIEKLSIGVKDSDNKKTYHGHCWPGESVWIDSLNPNGQELWSKLHSNGSEFMGLSTNMYLWNDMNEPSVFNGPETSAPKDLIHYGNWEHRSIHNLYGLSYIEMTYQSLIDRNPNKRPFILTRSFFSGSQRTAAMWTGDNMAKWEYLKESIPMILTLNLVGYPFSGADVGGFFGNPEKELLTRWYQAGIWYPFFRAHAHIDSRRHEPWVAGDPYTSIMRDAVRIRYSLLPLLYTQFYKTSIEGTPIMKPIFYDNSDDLSLYDIDDEFIMGTLLVKPVTEENVDKIDIILPDDEVYYNFNTFKKLQGKGKHYDIEAPLSTIPIFIKGGTITPMKTRYRRSSKLMKYDPYTLVIALNKDNNFAKGDLYIDDGETFGYKNNKDYINLEFIYENGKINSIIKDSGDIKDGFINSLSKVKIERIVILGLNKSGSDDEKADVIQGDERWSAQVLKKEDGSIVIRNPKVTINQEWMINLK